MSHAPQGSRTTFMAREIMNAGEGNPGSERKVSSISYFQSPAEAAEYFVSELVGKEMREQRWSEEDIGGFDGCRYVVEVRYPESEDWHRFSVQVKVKLDFAAEPARCEKCG